MIALPKLGSMPMEPTAKITNMPSIKPPAFALLAAWRYVEHAILRMYAGRGRDACDWEDKLAVCEHLWLQAENVQELRTRLDQFPGGAPEPDVRPTYETLVNAVFPGADFPDLMARLHEILLPALDVAYQAYLDCSHAVHDAPTFQVLRHILGRHAQLRTWYASYRRRYPRRVTPEARDAVRRALRDVLELQVGLPLPVKGEPVAAPCGERTEYGMAATPGRKASWESAPNVMPFLKMDFGRSVEARRLFFMIGYFWEMGVAEDQLRWVYHASFMPWKFTYQEAPTCGTNPATAIQGWLGCETSAWTSNRSAIPATANSARGRWSRSARRMCTMRSFRSRKSRKPGTSRPSGSASRISLTAATTPARK
jgi:hypothetical protein